MNKTQEALKLAQDWFDSGHEDPDEFTAMIKEVFALAEQPAQQEPVSGIVLRDGTPTFVYDHLLGRQMSASTHPHSQHSRGRQEKNCPMDSQWLCTMLC